jgi:hypothetical protein
MNEDSCVVNGVLSVTNEPFYEGVKRMRPVQVAVTSAIGACDVTTYDDFDVSCR